MLNETDVKLERVNKAVGKLYDKIDDMSQRTKFMQTAITTLAQDVNFLKSEIRLIKENMPKNGSLEEQ